MEKGRDGAQCLACNYTGPRPETAGAVAEGKAEEGKAEEAAEATAATAEA